jgi:broad specificity phosphatase PhoE
MDAAVSHAHPPDARVRPGRIIVVRHGRPALDREAGPRLHWKDYAAWWQKYEAGSLAEGQTPPPELIEMARTARVFSSARPRAKETAGMIAEGREVLSNSVFNEAPLPPPQWSDKRRYLPKTWNKFARLAWLMGHHGGQEKASETRQRAADAATVLTVAANNGQDVVLAAHGWFNRMLRAPLAKRGWKCVRDGGDAYWSYRIYEKR